MVTEHLTVALRRYGGGFLAGAATARVIKGRPYVVITHGLWFSDLGGALAHTERIMEEQLGMFDEGGGTEPARGFGSPSERALARRTDPPTSHEAAAKVDVTKRERQALEGLRQLGGKGTSSQIAWAAGVDKWSISPRMKPLESKGKVRRTDERENGQIVWEVV